MNYICDNEMFLIRYIQGCQCIQIRNPRRTWNKCDEISIGSFNILKGYYDENFYDSVRKSNIFYDNEVPPCNDPNHYIIFRLQCESDEKICLKKWTAINKIKSRCMNCYYDPSELDCQQRLTNEFICMLQ